MGYFYLLIHDERDRHVTNATVEANSYDDAVALIKEGNPEVVVIGQKPQPSGSN